MNQQVNENAVTRQELSREEYEKKVTVAMAHYEYFDRLSRDEATRKARQEVAQGYVVRNAH